jgi:hypothetical protein
MKKMYVDWILWVEEWLIGSFCELCCEQSGLVEGKELLNG